MLNTTAWRCFTAVCLGLGPIAAMAHHSFAATFDVGVVNELEGEVTSIRWSNPHVLFTLNGTDEQGREMTWEIESHSLSIMRRMEISGDALRVGDQVRVAGHPARRIDNAMFVLHALLPSGQEIVFDPWGSPRWSDNVGTTAVWQASRDDAQAQDNGIFRVWSTSLSDPDAWLFPEILDPSLIRNYPLTAAALSSAQAFDPVTDLPILDCAAKGMPTIMEQPYPMEFVDQGDTILLRLEEYDTVRTIHMDRSAAPAGQPLTNLGYSTGRWEDESLVVTTTHTSWRFFDSVGIPLSEAAVLVERFTPSEDGSRLNLSMTVTDPATFTEPATISKTWLALPGARIEPYQCER